MSQQKIAQARVDDLNHFLADASVFARKAKHCHWNVRGRDFFTLHAEFEKLYVAWTDWIDEVAERIVALSGKPLPGHAAELKAATLVEETEYPQAATMVRRLVDDLGRLGQEALLLGEEADRAGDRTTANLFADIGEGIEKSVWMFRAYLEN